MLKGALKIILGLLIILLTVASAASETYNPPDSKDLNLTLKDGYIPPDSKDLNLTLAPDITNQAPNASLNNPPNGSTSQPLNVTLNITVTDSDGDLMNVTFYRYYDGYYQEFSDREDNNSLQTSEDEDPPIDTDPSLMNYSGTYNTNTSWNDGDWTDWVENYEDGYVNYTKPEEATGLIWKVKAGSYAPRVHNVSVPNSCWNYYDDMVRLWMRTGTYGGIPYVWWYCWDESGWNKIKDTGAGNRHYEEAAIWQFDGSSEREVIHTETGVVNGSESSFEWGFLEGSHNYSWGVSVTDGVDTFYSPVWSFETRDGFLNVSLVSPSSDFNVSQDQFFNFTINVSCSGGVCGDVSAYLDPTSGPNLPKTASTSGYATWYNVDNIKTDNDTAATIGTNAENYLEATNFSFSIPSDATIQGVEVGVELKADETDNNYCTIAKLISGGNRVGNNLSEGESYYFPTSYTLKKYGNSTEMWGLSLTPSDVNAEDFGFSFSVSSYFSTSYVDYISMTIYYTGVKGGLVSTTAGAEPFYTNNSNPQTKDNESCLGSMTDGDSCLVKWSVNATGDADTTHKFFAYANSTQNSTTVESNRIDITILVPKSVNLTFGPDGISKFIIEGCGPDFKNTSAVPRGQNNTRGIDKVCNDGSSTTNVSMYLSGSLNAGWEFYASDNNPYPINVSAMTNLTGVTNSNPVTIHENLANGSCTYVWMAAVCDNVNVGPGVYEVYEAE